MPVQDYRARLSPKNINSAGDILGPRNNSNILWPLYSTNGVLFPYTPSITTGNVAEYEPSVFIHSNYGYNSYVRSYPKAISIAAEFTAQTNDEAMYLLAVLHFFKSATKSYFGINPYSKAGTPPPVLIFNYLGDYQYNNVPVIIKSFDYTLPADIDYVAVNTQPGQKEFSSGIGVSLYPGAKTSGYTYVPTHLSVQLELDTQYTPIQLRNEFNLDKFRTGKLINKGYI